MERPLEPRSLWNLNAGKSHLACTIYVLLLDIMGTFFPANYSFHLIDSLGINAHILKKSINDIFIETKFHRSAQVFLFAARLYMFMIIRLMVTRLKVLSDPSEEL